MSYGVTIESGAMPWQIFQQDGGGKTCIQLTGGYTCGRFTTQPPFEAQPVEGKNVCVEARLVMEDSGAAVIRYG